MNCAEYAESRQKLLRTLLNEKACRVWVKGHCRDAEHKRAQLIEQWHEERAPEVEKAEQAVVQLQTLARPPRRIPDDVRTRIVTLKRRGDFQGALSEIGLFCSALKLRPSEDLPHIVLHKSFDVIRRENNTQGIFL
ncbi:hypothetical protein GKA01_22430 [Gluconobacter kanchanaburiensis NBRC 103587]|uniref:Uncharacterized protein n=1 Tax=Gluconobacter kanchanaburiensis NBRC 103587 TaxID=1307948 RepID=A0A511B9E2_9PROT|nr:hypothetical protein AA103587_0844 [Gluconobacter kanchanaburiensis NBRC 103587]GEK97046.1 hypothetical protein GKA01_22430 [Gluconobacter kanchanaburiensis NBRC 103587]